MTRPIALLSLAAAALITAASSFAPTAEAGGGIRLTFGGPLPSFVARPTPGYGGGSAGGYAAARKCPPKASQHASHRSNDDAKPRATAERHAAKSERQVAKAERKVSSPAAETKVAALTPDTATDTTTPVTGTKSLNAGALPPLEPIAAAEFVPSETIKAVDAPESEQAAARSGPKSETKAEVETAESGPQECKKFIPAVGVTVTVGCSK